MLKVHTSLLASLSSYVFFSVKQVMKVSAMQQSPYNIRTTTKLLECFACVAARVLQVGTTVEVDR